MEVEFDLLFDNIMSNQAPGLTPFEKSLFLTKAQLEVLLSYFNPYYNKTGEGFDSNERRQIDFNTLIETYSTNKTYTGKQTLDSRSIVIELPKDILLILNESVDVNNSARLIGAKTLQVTPLQYTEYTRLTSKPYKRPVKNQAWRLLNSGILEIENTENSNAYSNKSTIFAEVILGPGDTLNKYNIRYLRKPKPIVLIDLDDEGVTVDGYVKRQNCELDPILHHEIVQRAVELAKASYMGDLNSHLALGQQSATEKGVVAKSEK